MPLVKFKPSECTSLMNINKPASFIVLVLPNSLAALIELIVSPPALANPRICAFDACACNKNKEKTEVDSGGVTDPSTWPPDALTTLAVSDSSEAPNA